MNNPLLQGIKILDLSRLLPGPFLTLYLAQLGAEVIKIEEPDGGDYARSLAPELFEQVNRGKKSVTLDLRREQDQATFKALVKTADVVLESFRPGVMAKLNCDYEALKALNPRLVYASLTGYGQTGPYAHLAGHDMNYLGYAGVLDQMGAVGGPPTLSNVQIADLAGGSLTCGMAILAGIIGVQQSGQGCYIDAAMLDGSLALQAVAASTLAKQGATNPRGEDMLTGLLPNYRIYKCRDGRYLAVGALEPKFFKQLLSTLKSSAPASLQTVLNTLASDKPASKNRPVNHNAPPKILNNKRQLQLAHKALALIFRLRSRDHWAAIFANADACVTPVLKLEEALHNEQVQARGMVQQAQQGACFGFPVQFSNDLSLVETAPSLGANNNELPKNA